MKNAKFCIGWIKNPEDLPVPTEDEEQIALFDWAALQTGKYPELDNMFHIPNGGKRGKAEAGIFKAMGVKPGVSDVFLPAVRVMPCGGYIKYYSGLFIEMKRKTGGTVSAKQKDWLCKMRGAGYAAEVCEGWNQARKIILDYLERRYVPKYRP